MKKIISLILVLITVVFCFCSCTNSQKKSVYQSEGGKNAFFQDASGNVYKISSNTVTYATRDLSGDYAKAFKSAVKKLSATSSKINIVANDTITTDTYYAGTYSGSSNPYYKLGYTKEFVKEIPKFADTTKYTVVAGANAFNEPKYNGTTLSGSHIYFNKSLMDTYSYDAKTMLAMHELGHSVGFIDFYSSSQVYKENASVMKGEYTSGMEIITQYTEFDLQCIKDIYGE